MHKIKKGMLYILVVFAWFSEAGATPPDVALNYDPGTQILKIEVSHVTNNVREHYIRRLVVYKYNQEVDSMIFPRQETPTGFTRDVPLAAQPGDLIYVEAFCKEGGTKKAEIFIAEPQDAQEKQDASP